MRYLLTITSETEDATLSASAATVLRAMAAGRRQMRAQLSARAPAAHACAQAAGCGAGGCGVRARAWRRQRGRRAGLPHAHPTFMAALFCSAAAASRAARPRRRNSPPVRADTRKAPRRRRGVMSGSPSARGCTGVSALLTGLRPSATFAGRCHGGVLYDGHDWHAAGGARAARRAEARVAAGGAVLRRRPAPLRRPGRGLRCAARPAREAAAPRLRDARVLRVPPRRPAGLPRWPANQGFGCSAGWGLAQPPRWAR